MQWLLEVPWSKVYEAVSVDAVNHENSEELDIIAQLYKTEEDRNC